MLMVENFQECNEKLLVFILSLLPTSKRVTKKNLQSLLAWYPTKS